MKQIYTVVVGHLGTVFEGIYKDEAEKHYADWIKVSTDGWEGSKAYGESVCLFADGVLVSKFVGKNEQGE